jgi:hypothetical protein
MKKLLAVAALAVLASPAFATLQLSANINGVIFNCQDQAACDTNPLVGQLAIANITVAGVEILGSAQTQFVGATNFLNTSSFQIINHNATAIAIALAISGTSFLGPVAEFNASGSGTWQNAIGSNLNLLYYGDPANAQGADNPTDLPGTLLASFADAALLLTDSFSFSTSGPFAAANLYSMSLGTNGTLAGWNGVAGQEATLVGRSQAIVTLQSVPEPTTLALAGLGLLAAGWTRRRA